MSTPTVNRRWLADLEPGTVYQHPVKRTVTEFDNVIFSSSTMNLQPLHLDAAFAASTEYGKRIVNRVLMLGLVSGPTLYDLTLGSHSMAGADIPAPVRHNHPLLPEPRDLCRGEGHGRLVIT